MTKADGSIMIRVGVDGSDAKKELKNLDGNLVDLGGALKNLASLAASAFAVDKIVEFGKEAVDLASDLQEVQNVVDVTFGEGAAAIEDFSKSAASAFGMSELSAKKYTGTMGAMLKSMGLTDEAVLTMSTDMVALAGDMASFYNLDSQEAFDKIRAGISGETEPLKQLGINMSVANLEAYALSQGIQTAYKEMSQAEQATLRYNYLMQATADAQGDFARTSDSLANQQRILELNMENLRAEIGKKVLPTIQELTTAANGLLSGEISAEEFGAQIAETFTNVLQDVTNNIPALAEKGTQMVSGILSGIGAALPTLIPAAVEMIATILDGFVQNAPMLASAASEIINGILSGLSNSIPVLLSAIPGIIDNIAGALLDGVPMMLEAGAELLTAVFADVGTIIQKIGEAIPVILEGMREKLTEIVPQVTQAGIELLSALVDGLPVIIETIVSVLPEITESVIDTILEAVPLLVEAGLQLLTALVDDLPDIIETIIHGVSEIVGSITGKIAEMVPELVETGVELLTALITDLPQIIAKIITAIPEIIDAIVEGFSKFDRDITQIGEDLIMGLWNGIKGMASWIGEKIRGFGEGILNDLKDFFGIASPSKVFAGVGEFLMEGLAVGMDDSTDEAVKAAKRAAQAVTKATSTMLVPGEIGTTISSLPMARIASLPVVQIPAFAAGYATPSNQKFMQVVNMESGSGELKVLTDAISQAFGNTAGEDTGYLLREILTAIREGKNIVVDKRVLGKVTAEAITERARASGKAVVTV